MITLPRPLPLRGCAARRRHRIHRRKRAHPGRILSHVQRLARPAKADRALLRLPAQGNRRHRGAPALTIRMGTDRRYSAARSGDQDRHSAEKGRIREHFALAGRCRRIHRAFDQIQRARTRRRAHAADRLCLADRRARKSGDRPAGLAQHHRHAGEKGHHRDHSKARGRAVWPARSGSEGALEFQSHRLPAPDRHVPGEAAYLGFSAGNRPAIWRQTSHHRAALHSIRSKPCGAPTKI